MEVQILSEVPTKMYKSNGKLKYDNSNGYRLTVEVNQQLSDYYYSLIPKYYKVNRPRWMAHVTVVRAEKEIPIHLTHWGKYNNEIIEFQYDPYIHFGGGYYWLNILCKRLEEIRHELGLSIVSQYTRPPAGFSKYFHCTIGNIK